jgi:hypothetical protein
MAAALLLYDFTAFDLVTLAFVAGAHIFIVWVYLVVSVFFLPQHPEVKGQKNPFATSEPGK